MKCVSSYGVAGCYLDDEGTRQSVIIHNVTDKRGAIVATLYLDAAHKPVAGATADNVTVGACQLFHKCWKDKFIEGGLDNTFTSFRHTNQLYTVTFDNGDVDTFVVAGATSWKDQVEQMAAGLGSIMPWAQTVEPFQAPNGGDLPAPSVPLNQMFARYVGFRVCPGDKVPVKIEYVSDQRTTAVNLVVQYVETPTIYIDVCTDCDGKKTFTVDGKPYEPICAIPCEESFPEVPLAVCTIQYLDVCDNVNSDNQADWINITRYVQDCGDGPQVGYLTEDDGALVEYPLVGMPVNCATGEIIPEPVIEPPEPDGIRSVCFESRTAKKIAYNVQDFDPADLQVGDTAQVDFEITLQDGCTADNVFVEGAPFGSEVVENSPGSYSFLWPYDGNASPDWPISADITQDGQTGTLTGSDFYIASGGGDSLEIDLVGKITMKEFCFLGAPSVFQDSDGQTVDVSQMVEVPCIGTWSGC